MPTAHRRFPDRIVDVDELIEETRDRYEATVADTRLSLAAHESARIGNLCVIRESDANDYLDAEGLISQLAALFPGLPGIAAVNRAGSAPLRFRESGTMFLKDVDPETGEETDFPVHVDVISQGKTRACLFRFRDVYYLYSLSSAAKVDDLGNQEWTELLMKQLAALRPKNVRTIHISRFVRNQDVAGLLLNAMSLNVKKVWLGSIPLEMKGPRAPMDKLLFVMLSMAASIERDSIVTRNNAGKLNKLRHGIWIAGARSVPVGYKLDDEHRLLPDVDQREAVRELLLLVAERPTPKEFVKRLGKMGMRMGAIPSLELGERSIAFTKSPPAKWRAVLSHVPLYATGQHVVHHANPFPGSVEFSGLSVVKGDAGGEEVQVVMNPGVPEDGWAEPELIRAALAVAIEESARLGEPVDLSPSTSASLENADAHSQVLSLKAMRVHKPQAVKTLPWTGAQWTTGDGRHAWKLDSRGGARYVLSRETFDSYGPHGDDRERTAAG